MLVYIGVPMSEKIGVPMLVYISPCILILISISISILIFIFIVMKKFKISTDDDF